MERLISAGVASLGAANLAKEVSPYFSLKLCELIFKFNVDGKSMSNALAANRPGNIRDKAVKGARS